MAENNILSIQKAFNILDILVFEDISGKGMSLSELSKRLGQNTTTMHNILKTMIACGYISKTGSGVYAAGHRCREIGMLNNIMPGSARYRQIENFMKELAQRIDETLVFTILSNGIRIPLLRVDAKGLIRVDIDAFEHENIYATATGRVLAAYAKEAVCDLHADVWDTVNSEDELKLNLEKIRLDGFHKTITGKGQIVAMAVPVNIQPLGAIGCYAPVFRCNDKHIKEIIDLLTETAKIIEKENHYES